MQDTQSELRWIRYLLIIIALPIVVIILKTLKAIFIPLILAIFLAFLFAPLIGYLKRHRIPMIVVFAILIVIILIFFGVVSSLLYAATNSVINGLPKYQLRFTELILELNQQVKLFAAQMDLALEKLPMLDPNQLLSPGTFSLTKAVSGTMSGAVNLSFNLFLILVFLVFLVGDASSLERRLKRALGNEVQDQTLATIANIQTHLQRYLVTKTLISLATALVGALLMWIFGVDFVLVCAILLFVLNFIPNIGSILASVLPMLICLLQFGFGWRLVFFAVFITATQMLFGNILEPKIQGDRLNLTPIMVLISLIFWGWLWGITGMVLAVPITSAINIILRQIDEKNVVSAIISGS